MIPDHAMSEAVRAAYARGQEEESMEPLVRVAPDGAPVGRIRPGDVVVFYDIRGEREVELTASFTVRPFPHFPVEAAVDFVTMIEYHPDLPVRVAFPPDERLSGTLCEAVAAAGRRIVKVTETEKAIHLAYFLNGKRADAFPGEERVTPHSPKNPFAEPEMRAGEVAAALAAAVADPGVALAIGNVPNMDVVGHGEDRAAILRAVAAVDGALGTVLGACREAGAWAVVTADHGTVESWLYPEGTIDTGHTTSPVPLAVVAPDGTAVPVRPEGTLADVAPTVLTLLGLPVPAAMTGRPLVDPSALPAGGGRVALLICDGWGLAPAGPGNLVSQAVTPHMDALLAGPHARLAASGAAVGLPDGTVGNSEAGHLHIGAGRVVPSDRVRIERALAEGAFGRNAAFAWALETARTRGTALHLLGIVSFFSSHGSLGHLFALLEAAAAGGAGAPPVFIHGLLGRRGEKPQSGAVYVRQVEERAAALGIGRLVSVIGRHWALDREQNWDRVEKTYRLLVHGAGHPVLGG